jgi:hypothetical protein
MRDCARTVPQSNPLKHFLTVICADPTPDIAALNARRRRAVELRDRRSEPGPDREATGLSVPTIIQACRAFEAGGWAAIAVGAAGRPRATGGC